MNLDLTAVRAFVAAVDLQGFARAARKLHRTPGAISLQLKALEKMVGSELFRKSGRQQVLTPAGELLLGYARRLLQLNDDALLALRSVHLGGEVNFGMPQDFAQRWLPQVLARFARTHPAVNIGIKVGRSAELAQGVDAGELDLALAFGNATDNGVSAIASLPVLWLGHPSMRRIDDAPVPLLVLDAPCAFRKAAIEALDRAGIAWRIAMSSASVSAVWAAAEAGLGVTPRTRLNAPPTLADVGDAIGLPGLAAMPLYLLKGKTATNDAAHHLEERVRETLGELFD